MVDRFHILALSYKSASVDLRSQLSLKRSEQASFLRMLNEVIGLKEAMILSTCNRLEVMFCTPIDQEYETNQIFVDVKKLLFVFRGLEMGRLESLFDEISGSDALSHLFEMSVGLKSQILGDLEIVGQVKDSYRMTCDENMASTFMHRLMHTIFSAQKRVSNETLFRSGSSSLSYTCAKWVQQLQDSNKSNSILILGAGKMGSDVARNLKLLGFQNVTISNRTEASAKVIAAELEYRVAPFSDFTRWIRNYEVVISALSSDANECPVHRGLFPPESTKTKYVIDLAVPKSVDDQLSVRVINIDQLGQLVDETLEIRKQEIPKVQQILADSTNEFNDWVRMMKYSPMLNQYKSVLQNIRNEVLNEYSNANEDQLKLIQTVTDKLINKIVKIPAKQIRQECKTAREINPDIEGKDLIQSTFNKLFNAEIPPN